LAETHFERREHGVKLLSEAWQTFSDPDADPEDQRSFAKRVHVEVGGFCIEEDGSLRIGSPLSGKHAVRNVV